MGCLNDDGVLELYLGDDWAIPFAVEKKNSGRPFNLTGITEASIAFKNADGTNLTKLLSTYVSGNGVSITDAAAGLGLIEIPAAQTALLKKQEMATHSMVLTIAGKLRTVDFPKRLTFKVR